VFRWLHVMFGILWIGLLYYFNFVQIRVMPDIPAELKPAVGKYIAPEALFWFRWAALAPCGRRGILLHPRPRTPWKRAELRPGRRLHAVRHATP
jgi:uncharacterized membrane protein